MNQNELENDLSRLAAAFPIPSVAAAVMARIENLPVEPIRQPRRYWGRLTAMTAVAASLLLAIVPAWLLFFASPRTLQAQVQQAIAKAGTAHVTISSSDQKGVRQTAEIWYSREHGFREESPDVIIVDDGKQQLSWRPGVKGDELIVSRRVSRDSLSMIAEMFQLANAPANWGQERAASFDREINGRPCQGFIITPPAPNDFRIVVLADADRRIVHMEQQRPLNGDWKSDRETSIEYSVIVPPERFVANFPATARIVDADRVLEERYPLAKAVAKVESEGLLFAVHEVLRGENDLFFVLSSVRGTPEYLKQNPPERRRLNPEITILDVAEQAGGAGNGDGFNRAVLATAEEEGVHYRWWLAVRRRYYSVNGNVETVQSESLKLEIQPGRLRLPLDAIRRGSKANRNWVRPCVDIMLPVDAPVKTVTELCAHAHGDLVFIRQGGCETMRMNGGIKDNTVRTMQPGDVTAAEYAEQIAEQLEWLHTLDKIEAPSGSGKIGRVDPVELPASLVGQVLDQQGKPVTNANLIVRVLRIDKNGYPTDVSVPGPWTASTDNQGRYTLSTGSLVFGKDDQFDIKVQADNFVELSSMISYEQLEPPGFMPVLRLHAGRTVRGRLVDPQGNPVQGGIIRSQACKKDLSLLWDSGPLKVELSGMFSSLVPVDAEAMISIYPQGFAPRIIDLDKDVADLGPVRVESGTAVTGRVLDKQGHPVVGTVVAIQGEYHVVNAYAAVIGMAVKTDENGHFNLPAARGNYKVRVTGNASDYSRRFVEIGTNPPPLLPRKMELNGNEKKQDIIFREADSVIVHGVVRWSDGRPVADIEIRSSLTFPNEISETDLGSTRTGNDGSYILRLPVTSEKVSISIPRPIRSADGRHHQAQPMGRSANAQNRQRSMTFNRIANDVNGADWVVD